MADTWVSRDPSKPYYGQIVTSKDGKVTPISTTVSTPYKLTLGDKSALISEGLKQKIEREGLQEEQPQIAGGATATTPTRQQLGQAALRSGGISGPRQPAPTLVSRQDYIITTDAGEKMTVSPREAVRFATPAAPRNMISAAKTQGAIRPADPGPSSPTQYFISTVQSDIGSSSTYAKGLLKSRSEQINKQAVDLFIDPKAGQNIEYFGQQFTKFGGGTKAARATSGILTGAQRELATNPAGTAALAAGSYGAGAVIAGTFSAGSGALTLASQAGSPAIQAATKTGLTGLKIGLTAAYAGGTAISAAQEYKETGTIFKTAISAGFGLAGAAQGAKAVRIENVKSPLTSAKTDLKVIRGQKSAKIGTSDITRSSQQTARDVLKVGETEVMKSKRFDIISREAVSSGVYSQQGGEQLIDATQTTTTYVENKGGVAKQIGTPKIEKATISVVDTTKKTTRPGMLLVGQKGEARIVPELKGAPTVYSSFEARLPSGEIMPGVQKTYIYKGRQIGEFEFTTLRSMTYTFTPKAAPAGYELTTKNVLKVQGGEAAGDIKDITAAEGIISTIAGGGRARALESTTILRKDATLPLEYDFSRKTTIGQDGMQITKETKGPKASYSVDVYRGATVFKDVGTRSTENIVPKFERIYPKPKPQIVVVPDEVFLERVGKDITPTDMKTPSVSVPATRITPTRSSKLASIVRQDSQTVGTSQPIVEAVFEAQKQPTRQQPIVFAANIQKPAQRTDSRVNLRQVPSPMVALDVGPAQMPSFDVAYVQVPKTDQRIDQILKLEQPTIQVVPPGIVPGVPFIGFPAVDVPPPPMIMNNRLPGFTPPGSRARSPEKLKKERKKYVVSLTTQVANLKAPRGRIKTRDLLGTEIRPFIVNKKRSKKR